MRFAKILLAAMLACAPMAPGRAQNSPLKAVNVSSTIAVTNTFQNLYSADASRQGCSFQNTGTNPMYLFVVDGVKAETIGNSFKITVGQPFNCAQFGITITNQIRVTGTATETFAATWE